VGETILLGGMGAASGRGSVATLADLTHLEVETDIAENLLSRVTVGQPAEISVSAVPEHKYRGKLTRIIPMGDRTRATVKVRVEVLDPDDQLFPDLAATVHFLPDKALENPNAGKSFLFVPKAAIVEENGFQYAWVLAQNGSVSRKKIEVVISGDDLARVEKGLDAGAKVVLNPPKTLGEGQVVTLAE
jgi:RND family efflux transporter MFP subunit